MEDIVETVKSLEDFGLLKNAFIQTIENGTKEQRNRFLDMLLGPLGATTNAINFDGCKPVGAR